MPNSNPRSIQVGSVDNTLIATVYNTDGSVKADLAFDTTGISIFVQRIGEANGSPLSLSAKATPQTAHADGAFLNLGGGDISVDVPDAPFATYKGRARIYGTFTGGTIIGEWFDVVGFDAAAVAVGANTTTPTNLSAAEVRTELATELARIDATISSRSTFAGGAVASVTDPVTVGTNNDKTGYALTQAFPSNFASLGITGDGYVSRVVLVDTTTTNTDMRGTDSALLAASYTAPLDSTQTQASAAAAITAANLPDATSAQISSDILAETNDWGDVMPLFAGYVWTEAIATGLTAQQAVLSIRDRIGAFAGTGANTILGFLRAVMRKDVSAPSDVGGDYDPATDSQEAIRDRGDLAWTTGSGGGGGGDATEANQIAILASLTGADVIQVASPNVDGNLVLTQGDTYDGVANPKATWNVGTDYTDGWAVMLTIRDKDDEIVYQTAGVVASATVINVDIDAPTGLPMIGCPGQWQGKFDVELSKGVEPNRSVKTVVLGACYINEDQTR
jgi:hypothetical protein